VQRTGSSSGGWTVLRGTVVPNDPWGRPTSTARRIAEQLRHHFYGWTGRKGAVVWLRYHLLGEVSTGRGFSLLEVVSSSILGCSQPSQHHGYQRHVTRSP